MKRIINGESVELICQHTHDKKCKCKNLIEISRKEENKLIVFYKICPKCGTIIEGHIIDLDKDFY